MTTTNAPDRPLTIDPRPAFFSAVRTACDTVAAVSPARLSDPTPCTEFDVRALLGHLVAVFRRVTSVAAGLPAIGHAPLVTDVPDDGWGAAARAAVRELTEAWADPAVLQREMVLPFGTLPGAAALAGYTGEVLTHTWDLAVATGQSPDWDDEVVSGALAAIRGKLPAATRPPGVPFADAVPAPADAPFIDRLVAWQGRDPNWRRRF
jgi:uncharacterized protein (TIGR03086 family)